MNFAQALRQQIVDGGFRVRGKRLLAIIDGPHSRRRTRILERLERHARVQMGFGEKQKIDWSTVDWGKLFEELLKFFLAILPFII